MSSVIFYIRPIYLWFEHNVGQLWGFLCRPNPGHISADIVQLHTCNLIFFVKSNLGKTGPPFALITLPQLQLLVYYLPSM